MSSKLISVLKNSLSTYGLSKMIRRTEIAKHEIEEEGFALAKSASHRHDHHFLVHHIGSQEQCAQRILVQREGVIRISHDNLDGAAGIL